MKSINLKTLGEFIKKSPMEFGFVVLILSFTVYALFPVLTVSAYEEVGEAIENAQWQTEAAVQILQNEAMPIGVLPEAEKADPRPFSTMTVTAYNSVPWQTDATPCIGAQGTDICEIYELGENVCAANFVPLGTVLVVDGLGECTVRDRMNSRYYYRVDWYMGMDIDAARQFGSRQKAVSVYPSA